MFDLTPKETPGSSGENALVRRPAAVPLASGPDWDWGQDPDEVDYGHLVRRYSPLALLLMTLGCLAGFASLILTTPVYKTRLLLEVGALSESYLRNSVDPLAQKFDSNGVNLQTEVRLLQSGPFVGRVVQKLKQDPQPLKPVSPDFAGRLRMRLRTLKDQPELLSEGLGMAAVTFDARPVNGTRLVELSCDSTNPELASQFLNGVAAEFLADSVQSQSERSRKTSNWIRTQYESTETKLQAAESNLREFMQRSGNLVASAEGTLDDVKLKQLQSELATTQADRIAKQAKLETALKSKPESIPEILEDESIQTSRAKLQELQRQESLLLQTLTPANVKVQRIELQEQGLQSAIDQQTAAVIDRLRNNFESASRREKLLAGAYASQGGHLAAQAGTTAEYFAKKREVESLRTLHDSLLQQMNQNEMAGSVPVNPIRLVEPSSPPTIPYKPRPMTSLGMGLMAGLAGTLGIAFLREKTDRSVTRPGATRSLLRVPELGVIPSAHRLLGPSGQSLLPVLRRRKPVETVTDHRYSVPRTEDSLVAHVAWGKGPSVLAEAFRSTLTSLMREANRESACKVILVTSALPGEGKTTMTANLGITLADTGRRVVVVDADLRRPRLHKVFARDSDWGLANLLEESAPVEKYGLDDVAIKTAVPNLYLLASGKPSGPVSRLIYSPRLGAVISRLRSEFDIVLIDAPPILSVADARVIAPFADGAAVVVRAGETDRASIVAACQCLNEDGVRLLGTVLNHWDPRQASPRGQYAYYQ